MGELTPRKIDADEKQARDWFDVLAGRRPGGPPIPDAAFAELLREAITANPPPAGEMQLSVIEMEKRICDAAAKEGLLSIEKPRMPLHPKAATAGWLTGLWTTLTGAPLRSVTAAALVVVGVFLVVQQSSHVEPEAMPVSRGAQIQGAEAPGDPQRAAIALVAELKQEGIVARLEREQQQVIILVELPKSPTPAQKSALARAKTTALLFSPGLTIRETE
ncbi:hypothetical protein [Accumulibacter sp.]|uniref:hypothetical protein n=1 Tax=Accumulibacter sp. TaxID=2053492 RepID=UPI0025EF4001|nr:hypothetical protein [Accumulibacter sp.]MCM8641534.1 hypothetical protein [Accumulibacter sp.]